MYRLSYHTNEQSFECTIDKMRAKYYQQRTLAWMHSLRFRKSSNVNLLTSSLRRLRGEGEWRG